MSSPMGSPGSPFKDAIAGGGNLIVPFLQSPNFATGVSGWRIARDGSAEFQNVTTRGPVIVIDPLTGLVVASIGAAGNISGTYATIVNDIILQGQSLAANLTNGKGLVGFFGTFSTPAAPGNGLATFTDTAWFKVPIQGNRLYLITVTPLQINNVASFDEECRTRWVVSDTLGNGPTVYAQTTQSVNAFSPMINSFLYAVNSDPTSFNTTTFALQSSSTVSTMTFTNVGGWNLYCLDVGPLSGAMNVGGLGAPSGTTQRTTRYDATSSQSYKGNGTQLVSTDIWGSDFGDGNGATTAMCIFPGATIRSDLTGATIQSATLSMYCTTAEETNGSLAFNADSSTVVPATQATFTGGTYGYDDKWPVPGWFSVDILASGFLANITGGSNAMKVSAAIFGLAATRFAGASVANKPYITITYTK